MSFLNLFGRREPADGAVPALETAATGISLAEFDSAAVSNPVAGRRERMADAGSAGVMEALGAKVLHGWLQNRHQTLIPLTLNLSLLGPEQQNALARILASFVLAGRPGADAAAAMPMLRSWLAGLGAAAETLAAFDAALEAPMPLNAVFEAAQAQELTIYAYVAALMAADSRYPASVMLCEMVQARFDLPPAVVRSAMRRYRR